MLLRTQSSVIGSHHYPDKCFGVKNESRCIEEHRKHVRTRRSDVTPNAPAVLYLPLGGSTSQGFNISDDDRSKQLDHFTIKKYCKTG